MWSNNFFFCFACFIIISCSSEFRNQVPSEIPKNNSSGFVTQGKINSGKLPETNLPGKLFQNEISDTGFLNFFNKMIQSLEKCDSITVMNFINDYVEVGHYGCNSFSGNETAKIFLDSSGFRGCKREEAIQDILYHNQSFSVFCKRILKEVTQYGIKPFSENSFDCYGKIEGYKNYNFIDRTLDSLFFSYNLLLINGERISIHKKAAFQSEILQTVSDTFFISYTGAGTNEDEFKSISPDNVIYGFTEDKFCHYYDVALLISFRKIKGSWKLIKLYRPPGC